MTVTGPGGTGKTALAREVLQEITSPDRRGFVDLTPLAGGGLDEAVAGALGFPSFSGLVETIGVSEWVLVIDNCEHLLDDAAAVVDTLLEAAPACRVLATSREPLELTPEVIFRLGPLSTEGSPSPAAELFVSRARARGVEAAGDPDVIEEICARLDGLPLAIELAAARTGSMTAPEILHLLESPLDVLSRRRSRGPQRHNSLAATIEWSYDMLDEQLRLGFDRLTVLEGLFDGEMAAAALGADTIEGPETLEGLVERSLLVHEPRDGRSSYRMLETIRVYGEQRSRSSDEWEPAWARVADRVVGRLMEAAGEPVMGPPAPTILSDGFPMVRRVIERHLDEGNPDVLALVVPFWWLEDIGHQAEAADLIDRCLQGVPAGVAGTGTAHGLSAGLHRIAGRIDRARRVAEIAAESGEPLGEAFGHRVLGQLSRAEGEWDRALEHLGRGVDSAKAAGQPALAIEIEMHAAMTHARAGDLDRAVDLLETLVERSRPYPLCRNWTTLFLSWILLAVAPTRSERLAGRVLADPLANRWAVAAAELHAAMAGLLAGGTHEPVDRLTRSLRGFASIRNTTDIKEALLAAAALLSREGRGEEAAAAMAAVHELPGPVGLGAFELALYRRIGPLPEPGVAVAGIADVEAALAGLVDGPGPTGEVDGEARFVRQGELWLVAFEGRSAHAPDSKGMGDLAVLLGRPGKEVAALDLMGSPMAPDAPLDSSDARARREFEARIRELQADLDEAEANHDPYRAERAREELETLAERLASDFGLQGRPRRGGDQAERARSAVTWRIRAAIDKLREVHPRLAGHLDASVRTGRFCAYEPAEPLRWEV